MRSSMQKSSVSTVRALRSSTCCITEAMTALPWRSVSIFSALNGKDLRKRPLVERKTALSKLLIRSKGGIQYVEHADGHGERMFAAVCRLGLEGIVSKRSSAAYRSGPTRTWIKVKNPDAPAATRILEGGFRCRTASCPK